MKIVNTFILCGMLFFFSKVEAGQRWRITKPLWTTQDELRFGEFVSRIGQAVARRQCFSVSGCLRSSANPYFGSDPSELRLYSDCGDLPYFLRTYFAWKNGLPMSFADGIAPRSGRDNQDIRYTRFGNYVTSRFDITAGFFGGPDVVDILNSTVINSTSSASYRMMGFEDNKLFSDFYPVKLERNSIRPGTVIYDPNGHVAIVFWVSDDGHIFYIDAHPDNSLTSGMYTPKFVRSYPHQGAGFKNFRPMTLVGARQDSFGNYVGGRIEGTPNSQLNHYSLEQFYGNDPDPGGDWQKGRFIYRGRTYNYYDYIRIMMALGDLKIDPLRDLRALMTDICASLQDRVLAVEAAIRAGINNKNHPARLPKNIYGTEGEWEDYATPARDARLKVSFMDLLQQTQQFIKKWRAGDPNLSYAGAHLPADLLVVYNQEALKCQFSYNNSRNQKISLNTDIVRRRLFSLSFDPYHCVELRWGAEASSELSTCLDSPNKKEWYLRERWLRYQWERRYDVRMDYSLDELDGPKPGAGISQPPDVDIVSYLNREKLLGSNFKRGP
jgi:hypothetical protein